MKKHVKMMALGLAGVMSLSGCGMKSDESAAVTESGEYDWEEPAAETGEYAVEAPAAGIEEYIAETPAAEIPKREEADCGSTAEAEASESLLNDYARSSGSAEEQKLAGTPTADLYAEKDAADGYLGSCYDFTDEEAYCRENAEEYSQWEEQGYFSVMAQPLSTFSADVDTASYSNLRRLIRDGYDLDSLPEGAVRIEELLNYFSYDYAEIAESYSNF